MPGKRPHSPAMSREVPRIFRAATLIGGFAVVAVALAAPAVADESAYVARLKRAQVAHMSIVDALYWGHAACDSLRSDASVPATITLLEEDAGFTNRSAGIVVGAAAAELCPDEYQIAMDWAHDQFGY
jgi:hypothetical protein